MPVSPLHGGATKCGRLAANDGMLEVATNKRVPPLAVLANVRVLGVAASNAKKLEVADDKWAKEFKFKNSDANTRARVTTWVDADSTEKISMRQDVENDVFRQPKTLKEKKQKTVDYEKEEIH